MTETLSPWKISARAEPRPRKPGLHYIGVASLVLMNAGTRFAVPTRSAKIVAGDASFKLVVDYNMSGGGGGTCVKHLRCKE